MPRTTVVLVTLAATLVTAPAALANPPVPQVDTPCSPDFANVMTWPPDAAMPLVCLDAQWQAVTSPSPPNDRWLSVGPAMTLHGEGQRNPSVASGDWTGTPQDTDAQCRAEQQTVLSPGQLNAPQISEGKPGQSLSLKLLPRLFSLRLSGYCLWTRTGS